MVAMYQTCAVWLLVCVCGVGALTEGSLTAVYMPASCGVVTSVSPSLQVESSSGLTYSNNLNCYVSLQTTSPFLLMAHITRFELEPKYSGSCNDFLNIHDGPNVLGSQLNADLLCGSSLSTKLYVSTGQQMAVHFVTDSAAVYLGFNIIVTAVSPAPCSGSQFQCNSSSYCIDSSLVCDNYQQCGDGSDESNCAETVSNAAFNWTPVIVGVTLGLLALLCLLAFGLYRRHRRNQWRRFANDRVDPHDLPDPDPAYPVTHKYFRGIRGHPDLPTYDSVEREKEGEKKGGGKGEDVVKA